MSTTFILCIDMSYTNSKELVRLGELCGQLGITDYSVSTKYQLGCVSFTIGNDASAAAFKMACHWPIITQDEYDRRVAERRAFEAKNAKICDMVIKSKHRAIQKATLSDTIKKFLKIT